MDSNIIDIEDVQDMNLSIAEWVAKHPDKAKAIDEKWDEEFDIRAELGRTDPEFEICTKLKDIQTRLDHIGNKPYEEMSDFEKKIIDKNDEDLHGIVQELGDRMLTW